MQQNKITNKTTTTKNKEDEGFDADGDGGDIGLSPLSTYHSSAQLVCT